MDVFDYPSHFFHRLALAHEPRAPVQLELHPGLHCDLYRCPHCYGSGQAVLAGPALTVAEIEAALTDIARFRPTVIVSGIITEPLTHPDAAGLIRAVRARGLPLGLYTKGRRLNAEVRRALVEEGGETFVTVSLDAISADEYALRHGIPTDRRDGVERVLGADYFSLVVDNLARLRAERDAAGSKTEIRGAFLLFDDSANEETVRAALERFGPHLDLLRFAVPQNRNDGRAPGALPDAPAEQLHSLAAAFRDEPKVKILTQTVNSTRDTSFDRCWAQRFQVVVDKAGYAFPCPQVAVQPHRRLSFGNIRSERLSDLLRGEKRLSMFGMDVDTQMRCRICDRKDEALNVALAALDEAYGPSRGPVGEGHR